MVKFAFGVIMMLISIIGSATGIILYIKGIETIKNLFNGILGAFFLFICSILLIHNSKRLIYFKHKLVLYKFKIKYYCNYFDKFIEYFGKIILNKFQSYKKENTYTIYNNKSLIKNYNLIKSSNKKSKHTIKKIFLNYVKEDLHIIKYIYKILSQNGFSPWMDVKNILPGQKWELCIERAIKQSNFFLACISKHSFKKRGHIQKEIRIALDICKKKLDSDIYIIPVRLEKCEIPDKLKEFQWIDFYKVNGQAKLIKIIQAEIINNYSF
jgi:hypothetical protein